MVSRPARMVWSQESTFLESSIKFHVGLLNYRKYIIPLQPHSFCPCYRSLHCRIPASSIVLFLNWKILRACTGIASGEPKRTLISSLVLYLHTKFSLCIYVHMFYISYYSIYLVFTPASDWIVTIHYTCRYVIMWLCNM